MSDQTLVEIIRFVIGRSQRKRLSLRCVSAEESLSNLTHPDGASSRNRVCFNKDVGTWEQHQSNRQGTGDMIT